MSSTTTTTAPDTKVCPLCAETIKVAAKVCPFCRARQGRWTLRSQEVVILLEVVVLFGMAGAVLTWLVPDEDHPDLRAFVRHRREVQVVQIALDQSKAKPECWISGFVTNTGAKPWRIHKLEVRFVAGQSNLVDVRHTSIDHPFVVQPSGAHAFRLKLGALAWTNPPGVPQVRVQTATDGRGAPQTD